MHPRFCLISAFALALALTAPAAYAAPSAGDAEHQRLVEDMQRLASRNAWRGVEVSYRQMEALEAKGVALTYADHLLGAQAARDAGDIALVKARLLRAAGVQKTDEVAIWLADIAANFGTVELDVGEATRNNLEPAEVPLAPDQRAAIDLARASLSKDRRFVGFLPIGTYAFGDRAFTVTAGGAVRVTLAAEAPVVAQTKPKEDPHRGLRLTVSGLAGRAGESDGAGPQPASFGGGGLRAGGGFDLGLTRTVGIFGEAAWIGVFGGGGAGGDEPARLQLGQGWGGVAVWAGPLRLSLGPTVAIGRASASGGSVPCAAEDGLLCDEAALGAAPLEARVVLGGGAAGLSVAVLPLGGGRRHLGLSLDGGLQSDLDRAYPWAAFGLGLSPG